MATPLVGGQGSFTTVTGDAFYTNLFGVNNAAGLVSVNSLRGMIRGESHDVTALNSSAQKTLTGLRSCDFTVNGQAYVIPRIGNAGIVAIASPAYYVTNAYSWSLTIEPYAVHDITSRDENGGSTPTWRSFRPDNMIRWYGNYSCYVDDTTIIRTGGSGTEPIQAPSITDDTATTDLSNITLTYGDSATDEAFSGECMIQTLNQSITRGERQVAEFAFIGSGPLSAVGTNNLFTGSGISGGNVVAPIYGATGSAPLVSRIYAKVAATSRYYETVDAFWTRMTISCAVGSPVVYSMSLVCRGAVTSN